MKRLILAAGALLQFLAAAAIIGWLVFGGMDSPKADWWILFAVVLVQGGVLDMHLADVQQSSSGDTES